MLALDFRQSLAQLVIFCAQALTNLHQVHQFLFERIEFIFHNWTIVQKTLLSQMVTPQFESCLETASRAHPRLLECARFKVPDARASG